MAQRKPQEPEKKREKLNDLTLKEAFDQGLENMVVSVRPDVHFDHEEVTITKIEPFAGRTDKEGKMIQKKKNVFVCYFSGREDPMNLSGSHPVIKADRSKIEL